MGWALWIAFLVAVSWPAVELRPLDTLDEGWQSGLHLARLEGLSWGPDIVFSYGPLGFLSIPKAFSATDIMLPVFYAAFVLASFATVVVSQLRRRYGIAVAVAGSFLLASLLPVPGLVIPGFLPEVAVLTAVAVGISALAGEMSAVSAARLPAAFGAAAAIQLLVKPSTGLAVAALGAVLALAAGRLWWRRLLELLLAFAVVLVVVWVAAHQSLGDLPLWVRRAASETSGYRSAMGIEEAGRHWEYIAAAALAGCLLLLGAASLKRASGYRAWPMLLLAGGGAWLFFEEGFTRHDGQHSVVFFFFVAMLVAALPWQRAWRGPALAVGVAASVIFVIASGSHGAQWIDPGPSFRALDRQLTAGVSRADRNRLLAEGRNAIRYDVPVPENLLALVGNEPVHVDTVNTAIVWAYDLNWRPVPIFQAYSAFTHLLDSANADRLRAADGPARVLRADEQPIDGRYRLQESPEYTLALVCNFAQLGLTGSWQVLGRVPNRCGEARELGQAQLRNGELAPVPQPTAPNMLVVGRIALDTSLRGRVRALLLKPSSSSLLLDSGRYRLLPETAAGPLLLRLTPALGWSPAFGRPVDSGTIGLADLPGSARIAFYEIPVAPAGVVG